MSAIITSPSETYNTEFQKFIPGVATTDKIPRSPFAHFDIQPLSPRGPLGAFIPYPDSLGIGVGQPGMASDVLLYPEMITEMKYLASLFSDVVYDDMGDSYLGNEMGGLRAFDDGSRPIFLLELSPHANESVCSRAALDLLILYLISDDPMMVYAREHLSFFISGTPNPDGMIQSGLDPDGPPGSNPTDPDFGYQSGRNTRNPVTWATGERGVNLNRQEPNYWDYVVDADKGTTYFSEPESQNIRDWLLASNRVDRVIFYCQTHGWESKQTWGYLTEWQIHTRRSLNTIRATFLHAQHLLSKVDFSPYTLLGDPPKLIKYNSKMKSYLAEWIWNKTSQPAACCLFEYPEIENSFGLVNTAALAIFQGFLIGASEACEPTETSYLITPAYNPPENANPFLYDSTTDQATGVLRPSWTRFNGVSLVQYPSGVDGFDTPVWRLTRPLESAWPSQRGRAGHVNTHRVDIDYISKSPANPFPIGNTLLIGSPSGARGWIVADTNTGSQSAATLTVTPIKGEFLDSDSLTVPGHSATANGDAYNNAENMFIMQAGRSDSGTLTGGHKERFAENAMNATAPIDFESQRGSMTHDGINIYFAGGFSDDGTYRNEIQIATIAGQYAVPTVEAWSTWFTMPQYMRYDGGTVAFAEGETITGGSSSQTAIIELIFGDTTSGVFLLSSVSGTFFDNEEITGNVAGVANVDGQNESGLQRHSIDYWYDDVAGTGWLYIVGGLIDETQPADGNNYQKAVWKINTSDKSFYKVGELAEARGYHQTCVYENQLWIFGGWGGVTVKDTVEAIVLTTDSFTTKTNLPTPLSRAAGALDVVTGIFYLGGGVIDAIDNTSNKVYAYELAINSVSEVVYELESDEDDDGHAIGAPLFPARPDIIEPGGYINYLEVETRCFTIVAGETKAGVFSDAVYELDLTTLKLSRRATDNTRWGYLRWSSNKTGVAGDQFCSISVVRDSLPQSDTRVPYSRQADITDPIAAWQQIHRTLYLVPPRNGFFTSQRSFEFQDGTSPVIRTPGNPETEVRMYTRIYGDNTRFDLACIQLIDVSGVGFCPTAVTTGTLHYDNLQAGKSFAPGDPILGNSSIESATVRAVHVLTSTTGILTLDEISGPFIDDEQIWIGAQGYMADADGVIIYKQADIIVETFDNPLDTAGGADQIIDVAFQPCFGSQMNVDQKLFDFQCDNTREVTKIELWYESQENFTNTDPVTPSLYEQQPEGFFKLIYTDLTGTDQQVNVFVNAELNHLRVYQGIWLQDVCHLQLRTDTIANTITLKLWFYGLAYEKTFSGTGQVSGWTATGSGVAYSQTLQSSGPTIPTEDFERSYQPRGVITVLGVDVTDQLMIGGLSTIETTLDTPDLTVYNAGKAVFTLENTNDQWNARNATNFFDDEGYDVSGYEAAVQIEFGYETGGGFIKTLVFSGKISHIQQALKRPFATITAVDGSLKFRKEKLHDFGVATTNYKLDNSNYAAAAPRFDFDPAHLPISKESVSGTIDGNSITVVPSIRREGLLDELKAEIDYENGILLLEAEPTSTAPPQDANVRINAKYAYSFRRPDALAKEIGLKLGLTAPNIETKRVKLTHWDTTGGEEWFSSHGRPNWQNNQVSVTRDLRYDATNERMWILTDTEIVRYDFADDTYTEITVLTDTGLASPYVFLKMEHDTTFANIFVQITDHKEGDSLDVTQHNRVYKYIVGTDTWAELADDDEYLQLTYAYDVGISVAQFIAENRYSFLFHNNYLYFKFAVSSAAPGDDDAGVKRIDIGTDVITIPYADNWNGTAPKVGIQYYLDFTIDTNNSKLIVIQAYATNQLDVLEMNLDGTSQVTRFNTTLGGDPVTAISDVVFDSTNNKVYFIVQRGTVADSNYGVAELWRYNTSTYATSSLQSYTRVTRGPRSGHFFNGDVYYFEGTHWDSWEGTFPDKTEAGRLIKIDLNEVITDIGFNWQSEVNADHQGEHTGISTNITNDGSNLHFCSGYGELGDIGTATRTTPAAPDTAPTNKRNNNIWVQWGFELASKIETFRTNDVLAWDALTNLAKVSQYQVSFSPEGKLRFLPRKFTLDSLATAIPMSGPVTTIDLNDASDFPDATEMTSDYTYIVVKPGQVSNEVFRYTDKTGDTLTGVERAQDLTAETSHSINDVVMLIHCRAYNHSARDNILDIQPLTPDFKNIYNHVRVAYGDNEVVVDATKAGDTSSPSSETRFGERLLDVSNSLLGVHDQAWAEIIGRDYYQFYADLGYEFVLMLRYTPDIRIGDTLLIDFQQRALLSYQPVLTLRVTHDFSRKTTTVLCRTYTDLVL